MMLTQEQKCRPWQKPVYYKALNYASLAISVIGIIINNLAIAAIPLLVITLLLYLHLQQTFEPSASTLVKLRGFIPAVELGKYPEEIEISQLQPIEELIDYLYRLETAISILSPELEGVEASVREILQRKSIAEIVAQLEHVYRTYDSSDWWNEGGKVLAGSSSGAGESVRERGLTRNVSDIEVELRDLAEELLEKLAEFWGDAA